MTTDRQCPSCGGFCTETGCERENVQPEQHSEQWWRHEVSNAWAQGYEKGRASVQQSAPVAWIKARELTYMKAVAAHGKTDWKTNLGLKPEDDDVPLYTAPPQREWQTLTDEEIFAVENSVPDAVITDRDWCVHFARAIEAKLKEKNEMR